MSVEILFMLYFCIMFMHAFLCCILYLGEDCAVINMTSTEILCTTPSQPASKASYPGMFLPSESSSSAWSFKIQNFCYFCKDVNFLLSKKPKS